MGMCPSLSRSRITTSYTGCSVGGESGRGRGRSGSFLCDENGTVERNFSHYVYEEIRGTQNARDYSRQIVEWGNSKACKIRGRDTAVHIIWRLGIASWAAQVQHTREGLTHGQVAIKSECIRTPTSTRRKQQPKQPPNREGVSIACGARSSMLDQITTLMCHSPILETRKTLVCSLRLRASVDVHSLRFDALVLAYVKW